MDHQTSDALLDIEREYIKTVTVQIGVNLDIIIKFRDFTINVTESEFPFIFNFIFKQKIFFQIELVECGNKGIKNLSCSEIILKDGTLADNCAADFITFLGKIESLLQRFSTFLNLLLQPLVDIGKLIVGFFNLQVGLFEFEVGLFDGINLRINILLHA